MGIGSILSELPGERLEVGKLPIMTHAYLLHLSPDHPQAAVELTDPYQMHRTLSSTLWRKSYTQERRTQRLEKGRLLFRLEAEQMRVWVTCQLEPFFTNLPHGYLAARPLAWEYDVYPRAGDELFFQLRTRPYRKNGDQVIQLKSIDDQQRWLHERASDHGFQILDLAFKKQSWIDTKDGQYAERGSIDFWGRLRVTDPILFAESMMDGIGRDRSVGMGLLLVERIVPWGQMDLVRWRENPKTPLHQVAFRVRRAEHQFQESI